MRSKSVLSCVIALTLFVSTLSLPLKVQGQHGPDRFRGDTGVITLGMGQVLRITVNGKDGNDTFGVRFAWTRYMPAGCNTEGVCRHTIQSQGATAPVNAGGGEAASFEMQGTGSGVRVVVLAFGDVAGDGTINAADGAVVAHVIMANTEGDFH
jgi:hypothetical protein